MSVVYPAPAFSVRDVARGYHLALGALGHEVYPVDLPKRQGFFEAALKQFLPSHATDDNATRLASEAVVIEIIRHRPDLALIVSGMGVHPDLYVLLRRAGIPTATIFTECPYDDGQLVIAGLTDYCFVNDRSSLMPFRRVNPRTWYLPAAYDPAIHRPVVVGDRHRSDVFLVGTGFGARVELLEGVDWTGIDLRLRGFWELSDTSPLRSYYTRDVIWNDEVARWYAGTKIALNIHRHDIGWGLTERHTAAEGWSINPRAYEIAACGAFQICDDTRPELTEVFGWSVPTFRDARDLEALIRAFLPDHEGRRRHAEEARRRVRPHTFAARVETLIACIESERTDLPRAG